MVLVAIVGELGCGKTLALTFLALHNFLKKDKKIYSNYRLKFPHTYVKEASDIDDMRDGFFAADELWLWLDSRSSGSKKNKFVSSILVKSRKRNMQIVYTTQSFYQIDVRIRNITDFIIMPILNRSETKCKIRWYTKESLMMNKPIKIIRFNTNQVFDLYDTSEEIEPIDEMV